MKVLIKACLLVGFLGGIGDNAFALVCPATDNVKVRNRAAYGIIVKYQDCQGQRIVSEHVYGGQDLPSVKVPEGKYVFVHYDDFAGDPKPFCTQQVPVGKGIEITTRGAALNPSCEVK